MNMNEVLSSIDEDESIIKLIEKFKPYINKKARILNYPEAETDLVICLLENRSKLKKYSEKDLNEGQLNRCILTTLDNKSKDLYKKSRERIELIYNAESILGGNDQYDFEFEDLISDLNEKEKIIILKKYVEGKTFKEIGDELGVSKQAIYKSHKKAITKLKVLV